MFTGMLVTDRDNHIVFKLNEQMIDKSLGHYRLIGAMSLNSIVLCGKTSVGYTDYGWAAHQTPLFNKNAIVRHEESVKKISEEFPNRPIVVVGNWTVLKNIKYLDRVLVFKYRNLGIEPSPSLFDFPADIKTISKLINFDILSYEIKHD